MLVIGVLVVVTGIAMFIVVVALDVFSHVTGRLSGQRGPNSSITHNPLGLQAKSVLYTGEISTDNDTQAVKTSSLTWRC